MAPFSKSLFSYSSIRLFLATGAAFILIAGVIVALVYSNARQQALADAEARAMVILNRNLATHAYINKEMKPRLFELTGPFLKPDHFDPTWMSSTYAVREIDRIFKTMGMGEYYYKECAINARSPLNEADEFEKRFIKQLNADPLVEKESGVRLIGGMPYLYVLRRGESMENDCMRCHSESARAPGGLVKKYGAERSFHRVVGEVVSAISIRIPLNKAYADADALALKLSWLMLGLLVILFAVQSWFGKKLLFSPLLLMRDKALQITKNRESLGEQIPVPSGQELNELATAFNQMSVSLQQTVEGLEQRVQERTRELEQLNLILSNDIVERKRIEDQISRSLKEKEVLLKEIHHRVKNNMQVVSSLLNLQAHGIADATMRAVFADARNRVSTMALIHEKLYKSPDLAHINFNEYLQSLVAGIADTYHRNEVAVSVDTEMVALDVSVGIPCGLIVNELVSNCLKYAFPAGRKGTIKIGIHKDSQGNNVLSVADDGIGFPEAVDFRKTTSLGLQLVNILTDQIHGTVELVKEEGTTFRITFPEK